MRSVLMTKIQKNSVYILLGFSVLFFITRVPRLWNDTINPDSVNWHYRTEQFMNGIKYQQWEKTYQHYHPGVTLMWITGVSTEIFKHIYHIRQENVYNFQAIDFISKFSIVYVQLVLSLYIIFILRKYFGIWGSSILVSLFSFEPFFVGNSRLYHLDVLFALFVFASLITGYLAIQRNSYYYYVATGILLSLSVLTKSIGMLAVIFYSIWFIVDAVRNKRLKRLYALLVVLVISGGLSFALFPALWVRPIYYINFIISETFRVGIRVGHEQLVFDTATKNASYWFYFITLALKSSPVLLLGVAIFAFYSYRLREKYKTQINSGFILYLALFLVLYLLGISVVAKKVDRYITLIYPILAVFSYYGYLAISQIKGVKIFLGVLLISFIVIPLITLFPYYFTYTNPLFGSPVDANRIIGQKPFGIGVYDLKDFILTKYRDTRGYPHLGFLDIKPMESIYPNSSVFDIRVDGVDNFDYIVLGINETLPDRFATNNQFVLSSTMNINRLEYWRIYAKQK